MSPIDVSAASILREAVSIYEDAQVLNLNIPKHINVTFRNLLASPQYRDILSSSSIDSAKIGRLLGNKHRWDQPLCKYFALRFLQYFMERTPRSKFDPRSLTIQYSVPNADPQATLFAYNASQYASQYVDFGPTLFLGNNRYITIKIKSMYPNVTKGLGEFQLRWINMRYTKTLDKGNVDLQPLPEFKAKRVGSTRSYQTRGQISSQDGLIANFSYCQLANAFKEICHAALDLLVGKNGSVDASSVMSMPFDLLNLIEKRDSKFQITTFKALGPLFTEGGVAVGAQYRINGHSEILFLYGSESDISRLVEIGEISSAYAGENFRLASHNLYGSVEPGEPLRGLLFRADRPGGIETSGLVFWDTPARIESYEILDEGQILEIFGV